MTSVVEGLALVEREEQHGRRRLALVDDIGTDACWLTIDPLALTSASGVSVAALGIGNVNTPEPYRRRGLATRLLQLAIDRMRADRAHASLLYGIDGFYEPFGWRTWGDERWVDVALASVPAVEDGHRARPATGSDLAALAAAYAQVAASTPGADDRSSGRAWAQWEPAACVVVERGDELAGWAWRGTGRVPELDSLQRRSSAGTVVFAELQAVDDAAMLAVLAAAGSLARSIVPHCDRIVTGASESHPLRRLARTYALECRLVDEVRPRGGAMLLPFTATGEQLAATEDPFQFLPDRF